MIKYYESLKTSSQYKSSILQLASNSYSWINIFGRLCMELALQKIHYCIVGYINGIKRIIYRANKVLNVYYAYVKTLKRFYGDDNKYRTSKYTLYDSFSIPNQSYPYEMLSPQCFSRCSVSYKLIAILGICETFVGFG